MATVSEADILDEVLSRAFADLHPDAARSLLGFRFEPKTIKQIQKLLQKNNRGTISAEERITLEKYLRVGQFLDLLHAKAKVVMGAAGPTS